MLSLSIWFSPLTPCYSETHLALPSPETAPRSCSCSLSAVVDSIRCSPASLPVWRSMARALSYAPWVPREFGRRIVAMRFRTPLLIVLIMQVCGVLSAVAGVKLLAMGPEGSIGCGAL